MKKVFIPGLKLVLFSGESGRRLWEAKDRATPILENGDMAIVPEGVAALICRKSDFNILDDFNIFASEKGEEQFPSKSALTEDEIELIVEKYLNDNNLFTLSKEKNNAPNVENLESKLTSPPPADDESLDKQEPTLDLENIKPLEEFETKDDLEIYGINFGINLNKTKKLENMYADLLAHIETLKTN